MVDSGGLTTRVSNGEIVIVMSGKAHLSSARESMNWGNCLQLAEPNPDSLEDVIHLFGCALDELNWLHIMMWSTKSETFTYPGLPGFYHVCWLYWAFGAFITQYSASTDLTIHCTWMNFHCNSPSKLKLCQTDQQSESDPQHIWEELQHTCCLLTGSQDKKSVARVCHCRKFGKVIIN